MAIDMLIKHSSPTLAGLKTGNLFVCPFANDKLMRGCIRQWNHAIVRKGLRALPLRYRNQKALIYVYRISHLSRDFQQAAAQKLLTEKGYFSPHPAVCIIHLINKLALDKEFPHEIGLFLGYPPEDVYGFINNSSYRCKCTGYWKVYGDEALAKNSFRRFKKCTEIYCAQYAKGIPLERLTVAG